MNRHPRQPGQGGLSGTHATDNDTDQGGNLTPGIRNQDDPTKPKKTMDTPPDPADRGTGDPGQTERGSE